MNLFNKTTDSIDKSQSKIVENLTDIKNNINKTIQLIEDSQKEFDERIERIKKLCK